jgi:hypothetical protein
MIVCQIGSLSHQLEPLPGATDRYLCPPGGTITELVLTGNAASGCGKPEPPGDQSIHLDRVEVVDTWSVAVTTRVRTTDDGYSRTGWVRVASPYAPFGAGAFAAGSGSGVRAPEVGGYGRELRVDVDRRDVEDVDVQVTIYGPCAAQPCVTPADATLEATATAPR